MFDKYIFYFINSKINTMKTAVEWLIDALMINDKAPNYNQWAIDKAKEMEKQQIMNAWLIDGYTDLTNNYWVNEFEEYYNETFKSE
jgi:hypothetical protein